MFTRLSLSCAAAFFLVSVAGARQSDEVCELRFRSCMEDFNNDTLHVPQNSMLISPMIIACRPVEILEDDNTVDVYPNLYIRKGTPVSMTINGTTSDFIDDSCFVFPEHFALSADTTDFDVSIMYSYQMSVNDSAADTLVHVGAPWDTTIYVAFSIIRDERFSMLPAEFSLTCAQQANGPRYRAQQLPMAIHASVRPGHRLRISFTLDHQEQLTFSLYDMSGNEVARLAQAQFASGKNSVVVKTGSLASGRYLIHVRTPAGGTACRRVFLYGH